MQGGHGFCEPGYVGARCILLALSTPGHISLGWRFEVLLGLRILRRTRCSMQVP